MAMVFLRGIGIDLLLVLTAIIIKLRRYLLLSARSGTKKLKDIPDSYRN
jgi:hypothetical protein